MMKILQKSQNAPKLRFPGYETPWKSSTLGKISTVNPNTGALPDNFYYIDLESVTAGVLFNPERLSSKGAPSRAQRVLKNNDILFQMVRPYQRNNYFFDLEGDYVASTGYAQIRTESVPRFLFQLLYSTDFVKKVSVRSTGTNYPAINTSDLKKISFFLPTSVSEQEKIAAFLGAVDEKIAQLSRKKDLLDQYKTGCMQKLFSQEIRFKKDDGSDFPDWDVKRLNEVLFETKARNFELEFDKADVLSVSGEFGIVNQIEHLGRSYAGASVHNYHIVETGDVVYTKSPLKSNPYGIIKANKGKAGIVSTLYAVYRPYDSRSANYLDHYFSVDDNLNRYLRPLVRKGAKNDMKINNAYVLNDPIKMPSPDEQERIADFLSAIDTKIDLIASELDHAKAFKKGLLQQMFV